ncbi:MAG: serine/threonine-protein kinase [Labilithrix sp.]
MTAATISDDHRRALARNIAIGGLLFPSFFGLDIFAVLTLHPDGSLLRVGLMRVATGMLLLVSYFVIMRTSWPRVAYAAALGAASVSVALLASEVGGPGSPYVHGLTLVILMRAAIVPEPLHVSLAHGLFVAACYPITFWVLFWRGARWDLNWPSMTVNYLLVVSAALCACAASHTSWRSRQQLQQARKLGRYRLEARLGHGAQGEVWLAHDESLEREVALKILRAKDASAQAIEAFEREAMLISKLKSPHTVRVHDFGASDDGIYFMAMEHLVGHDFAEMVKLFGPATPAHAAHLVKQACHSLEEAHAAGLVHRDVKPSNLYAAEVGEQRDVVKLLDFGIARSILEGDLKKTAIRGTPTYLAPEVAKGGPSSVAADLYALGATLYFLVTGTPPFVGDVFEVLKGHAQEIPERPSSRLGREVPAELEAIILRCLEKDPEKRWASARDLRVALEGCKGIEPWSAADARRFWELERKELVRKWTEETVV